MLGLNLQAIQRQARELLTAAENRTGTVRRNIPLFDPEELLILRRLAEGRGEKLLSRFSRPSNKALATLINYMPISIDKQPNQPADFVDLVATCFPNALWRYGFHNERAPGSYPYTYSIFASRAGEKLPEKNPRENIIIRINQTITQDNHAATFIKYYSRRTLLSPEDQCQVDLACLSKRPIIDYVHQNRNENRGFLRRTGLFKNAIVWLFGYGKVFTALYGETTERLVATFQPLLPRYNPLPRERQASNGVPVPASSSLLPSTSTSPSLKGTAQSRGDASENLGAPSSTGAPRIAVSPKRKLSSSSGDPSQEAEGRVVVPTAARIPYSMTPPNDRSGTSYGDVNSMLGDNVTPKRPKILQVNPDSPDFSPSGRPSDSPSLSPLDRNAHEGSQTSYGDVGSMLRGNVTPKSQRKPDPDSPDFSPSERPNDAPSLPLPDRNGGGSPVFSPSIRSPDPNSPYFSPSGDKDIKPRQTSVVSLAARGFDVGNDPAQSTNTCFKPSGA